MELDCFPLQRGPLSDAVGRVGGWNITSYFGPRIDPIRGGAGNHGGQDIAGPGIDLQPLYAVVPGYVSQGWDSGGGGNWTTLYAASGARFGYGHAHHYAPGVNGKQVAAGTLLAYVGTTGASTGSHLHFAYDSEDGNTSYDDPFDILQRAADAGRYAGSGTFPAPTPPEGLTMSEYNDIMGALARIEQALGTNLSIEGQWEQDTRSVVIEGTARRLLNMLAGVDGDAARAAIADKLMEAVSGKAKKEGQAWGQQEPNLDQLLEALKDLKK